MVLENWHDSFPSLRSHLMDQEKMKSDFLSVPFRPLTALVGWQEGRMVCKTSTYPQGFSFGGTSLTEGQVKKNRGHLQWQHHKYVHHCCYFYQLTSAFLNHRTHSFDVLISQFEDIVKTIKHHLDHLRILYIKQVAQRPYHTLTDDISHLHKHTLQTTARLFINNNQ